MYFGYPAAQEDLAGLVRLEAQADRKYGVLNLSAREKRAGTLQLLQDQLHTLAEQKPVLLVLEDAQ